MGSYIITTNGADDLLQFDNTGKLPVDLDISGHTFTGSGAGLTDLPGGNITPGSVPDSALASMPAFTIKGNATAAPATPADIVLPWTGYKNILIGGDFSTNPWYRGTAFTGINTTATYTADRWFGYAGSGAAESVSRQTGISLSQFTAALRVQRPSGNTNVTGHTIAQVIESSNALPLQGETCTLSFWARAGADFSASGSALAVNVTTGTGIDQGSASLVAGSWTAHDTPLNTTQALTTSWARYAFSVAIGGSAAEVAVILAFTPSGTAGAADYFEVTGVQLEPNAYLTNFERRPVGLENDLCARYLPAFKSQGTNEAFAMGQCNTAGLANFVVPFVTTARTVPGGIFHSSLSDFFLINATGTPITPTAIATNSASITSGQLAVNCSSGLVAGNASTIYFATASGLLYFTGCEL